MTPSRLRIATRKSPLALWQAEHVRELLQRQHPRLTVELAPITTEGDRRRDRPLATFGGKGLFIKALEEAMLDDRADIAVHSMKDVPTDLPPEMDLPVILEGGNPFDAFISNDCAEFSALPEGARLGTASLRRQAQLKAQRPDLQVSSLRGNVGTRLKRLDEGRFDAIILACAGLQRLGLQARITQSLPPELCLPAIGQGAIGIETRRGDEAIGALLQPLDHAATHSRLRAERALNARLAGSCHLPIAAYATLKGDRLQLRAWVGLPDGSRHIADAIEGATKDAEQLGASLAERMLEAGAGGILETVDPR